MRFDRYNRIAQHYPTMWPLLVPGYVPILNAMQDIVRVLGERPREILDLGCGPGTATVAVAPSIHPEGMVTLVDGAKKMLDEAKALLGQHVRCTFLGDFTRKEIARDACPPSRYDLALCSFALHHIPDYAKREVIGLVAAALQPGGLMLLAEETAVDRPAGWDVIERIRGRIIKEHLESGNITEAFWELETGLEPDAQLPFMPPRLEDLTSWMAGGGLAVSCPVSIFGSALLIGVKPDGTGA